VLVAPALSYSFRRTADGWTDQFEDLPGMSRRAVGRTAPDPVVRSITGRRWRLRTQFEYEE
jgi:hypothetical protein